MAGSLNKAQLIGRLGQDPKLSYMPSGQAVAEMSVATDESYKDRDGNKVEKTEWHRVSVKGKSAEFCAKYLSKGRLVYVEGKLKTRKWEDKNGGADRYATEISVEAPGHSVKFMDSDKGGQQDAPKQGQRREQEPDYGPAFPKESSGYDDVPF